MFQKKKTPLKKNVFLLYFFFQIFTVRCCTLTKKNSSCTYKGLQYKLTIAVHCKSIKIRNTFILFVKIISYPSNVSLKHISKYNTMHCDTNYQNVEQLKIKLHRIISFRKAALKVKLSKTKSLMCVLFR